MESLNRMAIELVDEALEYAEELNVGVYELECESTVIDFGIDFTGGVEAGLLLTEIQTAGLATPHWDLRELGSTTTPYVTLTTDQPTLALLCSQKAGWELETDDFDGLGSGPARALVAKEDVFKQVGYADAFDLTVLSVEADRLPTNDAAEQVAAFADVTPSGVFLPVYPTASIVGSVTTAARVAELATFALFELGYDPSAVVTASGYAPVAPVAGDEATAIARTTDALAYGGRAHLVVREEFDGFDAIPSTAGEEYGTSFDEIFDDFGWSFEDAPAELFGPATVTVDVLGGETYRFGETNEAILAESFGY